MSINFEQLVVCLIFLVPGFISTTTEKIFQPRRFESSYSWTASSLLRSIGLNVFGISILLSLSRFGVISSVIFSSKIEDVSAIITKLSLDDVFSYIIGLYIFSVIWGMFIGIFPKLTLRAQANRLKLTSLGRHSSVWRRIRDEQRPRDRPHTWIKMHSKNGKVIFGRLRHSSSIIHQDKPVELYLKPVYEILENRLCLLGYMGQQADGIYVRLGTEDIVEFYFTDEEMPTGFQLDIPDV